MLLIPSESRATNRRPRNAKENFMNLPISFHTRALSALVVCTASFALAGGTTGCSSKKYVRAQTAPIVANVNELDEKTAADHRAILDTDERATAGITRAQGAADAANTHALAAGNAADQAQLAAGGAASRVDSLAGVIANLDQYKQLQEVSVTFKFDKATLTASDKQQLDALAANLTGTRGYILQLTGGTDSVGDADYNYKLSQRRADAVVTYLSTKYNVPPHKFYLVGIGKDQQVASDRTAAGRAQNRRVDVQLLSNMVQTTTTGNAPSPSR
jgi:outer membrane protein OmpA-like peptidoglycan-associated protein